MASSSLESSLEHLSCWRTGDWWNQGRHPQVGDKRRGEGGELLRYLRSGLADAMVRGGRRCGGCGGIGELVRTRMGFTLSFMMIQCGMVHAMAWHAHLAFINVLRPVTGVFSTRWYETFTPKPHSNSHTSSFTMPFDLSSIFNDASLRRRLISSSPEMFKTTGICSKFQGLRCPQRTAITLPYGLLVSLLLFAYLVSANSRSEHCYSTLKESPINPIRYTVSFFPVQGCLHL